MIQSRISRPFAPNQSHFKEDRGFIDWLDAALCTTGAVQVYDEAAASVYIWVPVLELV